MLFVDIEKRAGDFHLRASFEADTENTGILGASGCGKSMTLRCIAGIDTPDRGRIVLDDKVLFDSDEKINLPPGKRKVGYLFQNYALFPNMTVQGNIMCGLRDEKDDKVKKEIFERTIDILQLGGFENHRVDRISGGQQQRTALARILVNRPKLLMLDEPFSALDMHLRGRLQIEIKELLKQYNKPVLMVTHNRNEAYHMCSKISVMQSGKLYSPRLTKELFANPMTTSGAEITGCKNVVLAKKAGEYAVRVPEWGVTLETDKPVGDDLVAIGVRAHYFGDKFKTNRYEVQKVGEMEEPFEWIIRFRYKNQSPKSKDIWWRISKEKRTHDMPRELGVSPINVLPLYPSV